MTEKARKGQLLDSGLSTKSSIKANPYTIQMKCDGDVSYGKLSLMKLCFQEKLLNLS